MGRKEEGRDRGETKIKGKPRKCKLCPLLHPIRDKVWGSPSMSRQAAAHSVTRTAAAGLLWYLIHHAFILLRFVRGKRAPDKIQATSFFH